jgi:hypothetical protein
MGALYIFRGGAAAVELQSQEEISLIDVLRFLFRRKYLIAGSCFAVTFIAYIYAAHLQKPFTKAVATIDVSPVPGKPHQNQDKFLDRTYLTPAGLVRVLNSSAVMERVTQAAGNLAGVEMNARIVPENASTQVEAVASSIDAETAKRVASAWSVVLIDQLVELDKQFIEQKLESLKTEADQLRKQMQSIDENLDFLNSADELRRKNIAEVWKSKTEEIAKLFQSKTESKASADIQRDANLRIAEISFQNELAAIAEGFKVRSAGMVEAYRNCGEDYITAVSRLTTLQASKSLPQLARIGSTSTQTQLNLSITKVVVFGALAGVMIGLLLGILYEIDLKKLLQNP